ncbi:NUDIX domain-containing protein [Vibrio mediterranei]|uniref:NUDIX domain-containing protein n=1 Tax=Vibrio mediterranei TaxID=689 RepID=UPI0040697FAD
MYRGDYRENEIEILEPRVVFENDFVTIFNDMVRFPTGDEGEYLRVEWKSKKGVAVAPVHDGEIYLIRTFRHQFRQWVWEIPKGFCESHLTTIGNAQAELKEETGIKARRFKRVANWKEQGLNATLFVATELTFGEADHQKGECINEVRGFSVAKAKELLLSDEVKDRTTLIALSLFVGHQLE